jgi:hypothetical protein
MKVITSFPANDNLPGDCVFAAREVDFETAQNIDIWLPPNFNYLVRSVDVVPVTIPSAIATKGRLGLSRYDGTTATQLRGTVPVQANTVYESDTLFDSGAREGYAYLQNIAAATTSAVITQVTTLNTPGTATVAATGIAVPRKLRIVMVDNEGSDLAGTVTLVGTHANGEKITEIVTVVAGTLTYDTVNAFASLTSVSFDFGATATVTVDTMNIGLDTSLSLGDRYAEVVKLVSNGTVEAVGAADVDAGTFDPTTAPDGAKDYEVWFRKYGNRVFIPGGNYLRLVVEAASVTGDDVRSIVSRVTRF